MDEHWCIHGQWRTKPMEVACVQHKPNTAEVEMHANEMCRVVQDNRDVNFFDTGYAKLKQSTVKVIPMDAFQILPPTCTPHCGIEVLQSNILF